MIEIENHIESLMISLQSGKYDNKPEAIESIKQHIHDLKNQHKIILCIAEGLREYLQDFKEFKKADILEALKILVKNFEE